MWEVLNFNVVINPDPGSIFTQYFLLDSIVRFTWNTNRDQRCYLNSSSFSSTDKC